MNETIWKRKVKSFLKEVSNLEKSVPGRQEIQDSEKRVLSTVFTNFTVPFDKKIGIEMLSGCLRERYTESG